MSGCFAEALVGADDVCVVGALVDAFAEDACPTGDVPVADAIRSCLLCVAIWLLRLFDCANLPWMEPRGRRHIVQTVKS